MNFVYQPKFGIPELPFIIDECRTLDGIRIGRGNRSTQKKPASISLVNHKSNMTEMKPGLPH
jgi:hypothetical protein